MPCLRITHRSYRHDTAYSLWSSSIEGIAPSEWTISLQYDAKAYPERYLASSFYMHTVLEKMGLGLMGYRFYIA